MKKDTNDCCLGSVARALRRLGSGGSQESRQLHMSGCQNSSNHMPYWLSGLVLTRWSQGFRKLVDVPFDFRGTLCLPTSAFAKPKKYLDSGPYAGVVFLDSTHVGVVSERATEASIWSRSLDKINIFPVFFFFFFFFFFF